MIFPNFGFTNDIKILDAVKEFKQKAIEDGWKYEATYGKSESIDRACSLEREGFKMSIYTREKDGVGKFRYEASIHIWGPDGLSIEAPDQYDFEKIKSGLLICGTCGETGPTVRVAFANRCCEKCAPAMREKLEKPGWYD